MITSVDLMVAQTLSPSNKPNFFIDYLAIALVITLGSFTPILMLAITASSSTFEILSYTLFLKLSLLFSHQYVIDSKILCRIIYKFFVFYKNKTIENDY